MRHPTVGLLQAFGLGTYITAFALTVRQVGNLIDHDTFEPALGISLFLLAFVTSALICSAIAFGYPLSLFLRGERREALEVVGWTIAWCLLLLLIAGMTSLLWSLW